jgi:dihydrofolate reductase
MRKLIVTEYVTVDGVMEDPGGQKGGRGGWSRPFWSDEVGKYKFDELFAADTLLLGRLTYEGFAAAWPKFKDEAGFADRMNNLPKYVVSTTLDNPEWNNTRVIKGDLVEAVTALKQAEGLAILVAGSSQLVHSLRQHDLVDEYRLMVHPVVLGGGLPLFRDSAGVTRLKLLGTQNLPKGIVVLTYGPDRDQATAAN